MRPLQLREKKSEEHEFLKEDARLPEITVQLLDGLMATSSVCKSSPQGQIAVRFIKFRTSALNRAQQHAFNEKFLRKRIQDDHWK